MLAAMGICTDWVAIVTRVAHRSGKSAENSISTRASTNRGPEPRHSRDDSHKTALKEMRMQYRTSKDVQATEMFAYARPDRIARRGREDSIIRMDLQLQVLLSDAQHAR